MNVMNHLNMTGSKVGFFFRFEQEMGNIFSQIQSASAIYRSVHHTDQTIFFPNI